MKEQELRTKASKAAMELPTLHSITVTPCTNINTGKYYTVSITGSGDHILVFESRSKQAVFNFLDGMEKALNWKNKEENKQ